MCLVTRPCMHGCCRNRTQQSCCCATQRQVQHMSKLTGHVIDNMDMHNNTDTSGSFLLARKAWLPCIAGFRSVRPTLIWRHWRCWQPNIFGIRRVGAAATPPQPRGAEPRLHWKMSQDMWGSSGAGKHYCPVGEGVLLSSQSPISSRNGQTLSPSSSYPGCVSALPLSSFQGMYESRKSWHWTIILGKVQLSLCHDDKKL